MEQETGNKKSDNPQNIQPYTPNFIDMLIRCIECGRDFVFTANEQSYFYENHLATPKRCPECRQRRREQGVNR
jgi:DNA-directed RNA polymerase subunit RPC12/RpoP